MWGLCSPRWRCALAPDGEQHGAPPARVSAPTSATRAVSKDHSISPRKCLRVHGLGGLLGFFVWGFFQLFQKLVVKVLTSTVGNLDLHLCAVWFGTRISTKSTVTSVFFFWILTFSSFTLPCWSCSSSVKVATVLQSEQWSIWGLRNLFLSYLEAFKWKLHLRLRKISSDPMGWHCMMEVPSKW